MANEQTPAPTLSTNSGAAVEDNQNSIITSRPERFTNATGAPVPDNTNILTAGPRGPALLQDIWLIEKLAHFDREVIPERRMHAKGWGAHGTLTTTHDITKYTKAVIFSKIGKQTPMFARFSSVAGERGAADAERDIRGFALKFYTEEGNWDIVGNNSPVFFSRDPLRFSDLNHAIKRDPRTGLRRANNNWDFWTLLPEALHQVTIVMSDRGIPKSFRHMHGFGSHTFSMFNAEKKRIWVKFHFLSQQGIENLTDEAAAAVVANDRESNGRDLFEAIERGDFPRWTLFIQLMTEEQAKTHKHNPFDLTKVWPKADYPLIEVGIWSSIVIRKTTSQRWSKPPSPRRMWFPELASLLTRCSRAGCSLMEIPSDTASVLTSITSLLTRRSVHSTPITAMARCAQMETWERRRLITRIARDCGTTSQNTLSRRSRSKATLVTMTTA